MGLSFLGRNMVAAKAMTAIVKTAGTPLAMSVSKKKLRSELPLDVASLSSVGGRLCSCVDDDDAVMKEVVVVVG